MSEHYTTSTVIQSPVLARASSWRRRDSILTIDVLGFEALCAEHRTAEADVRSLKQATNGLQEPTSIFSTGIPGIS